MHYAMIASKNKKTKLLFQKKNNGQLQQKLVNLINDDDQMLER